MIHSPRSAGAESEAFACRYLEQQGLRLVERNYQCRVGELDLIMRDRDCLVFVEVRSRKRSHFGSAAESVTVPKQQRLLRAARHYLQHSRVDLPCRFDVIAITHHRGESSIEWIQDAFRAD